MICKVSLSLGLSLSLSLSLSISLSISHTHTHTMLIISCAYSLGQRAISEIILPSLSVRYPRCESHAWTYWVFGCWLVGCILVTWLHRQILLTIAANGMLIICQSSWVLAWSILVLPMYARSKVISIFVNSCRSFVVAAEFRLCHTYQHNVSEKSIFMSIPCSRFILQ